ncbi:hypothetical protein B0J14DRAFT_523298 [Halenospora varia]|nr:hypothetical protein B0J14DRAFT_523298 [Halenospora varia]
MAPLRDGSPAWGPDDTPGFHSFWSPVRIPNLPHCHTLDDFFQAINSGFKVIYDVLDGMQKEIQPSVHSLSLDDACQYVATIQRVFLTANPIFSKIHQDRQHEIARLKSELEMLKAEKQNSMAEKVVRGINAPLTFALSRVPGQSLFEENIQPTSATTAIQDATRIEPSSLPLPPELSTNHESIAPGQNSRAGSSHDTAEGNNSAGGVDRDLGSPNEHTNEGTKRSRVSRNLRKHQCKLCPKNFTRATTLREHVRTHDNDRRFKCDRCSKTFVRKKDWMRHVETHDFWKEHDCSGEMRVEGEWTVWGCRKGFSRRDGLRAHWRTKSGQKCLEKVLSKLKSSLKSHDFDGFLENPDCDAIWTLFCDLRDIDTRLRGCKEKFPSAEEWIAHIECPSDEKCPFKITEFLLDYAYSTI